MGIVELKKEVAEALENKAVMPVSDLNQAVSGRVKNYLTRNNLLAVVVPGWALEGGSGGVCSHLNVITALESQAFRDEVRRGGSGGRGHEKPPDEMVKIIDKVKIQYVQHEAVDECPE